MPLDVFLDDVPADKVFVMANIRSTSTTVIFIRNNNQGRKLIFDWLAIIMSGYIQCHGYDHAALAALIAQRIGVEKEFPLRPLNFSCIYTKSEMLVSCYDESLEGKGNLVDFECLPK